MAKTVRLYRQFFPGLCGFCYKVNRVHVISPLLVPQALTPGSTCLDRPAGVAQPRGLARVRNIVPVPRCCDSVSSSVGVKCTHGR